MAKKSTAKELRVRANDLLKQAQVMEEAELVEIGRVVLKLFEAGELTDVNVIIEGIKKIQGGN